MSEKNTMMEGMIEPKMVIDADIDELMQLDDALFLTMLDLDVKDKYKQVVKMYKQMFDTRGVSEFDKITEQFDDYEDYATKCNEYGRVAKLSNKIYGYIQGDTKSSVVLLNAVRKHLQFYHENFENYVDVYNYCNDFLETTNKELIKLRKKYPSNHNIMTFASKYPVMNNFVPDSLGKKAVFARKIANDLIDKYYILESNVVHSKKKKKVIEE